VLDDGFFLYFDDLDFCRRARVAGWTVRNWPAARVVHLRGRSNPVKEMTAERKRRPAYWYESRARYYAKHYGWWGLLGANVAWWLGRGVSLVREALGNKAPHVCEREWLDIWSNWRKPLGGRRSVQET
jgi:N-acetylglucosaminyl-diphospho-decaprenol L-rhamnosyltransferase